METPTGKTTLQELTDRDLAESEDPTTAVDLCDRHDSNYALVTGEIYKRTGRALPPNTIRNWHRAAIAARTAEPAA